MQQVPELLAAHLAQEVTTLAMCWTITRVDTQVLRFTDHDSDVVVEGALYYAQSGISPSAVTSSLGLTVDNLEFTGQLRDDAIGEADVLAGLYDGAQVRIFWVNYADTAQGILPLKTGWLGEFRLEGGAFAVEVRGMSALLQQTVGEVYTRHCRARLGDGRCGVNLSAWTVTGSVSAVLGNGRFRDEAREEARGHFAHGLVRFTSGANAGASMEVRSYHDGEFALLLPLPKPLAEGDTYEAVAGCDKAFDTCVQRFSNAVNFRGEPHVPGTDKMLETSATRSK